MIFLWGNWAHYPLLWIKCAEALPHAEGWGICQSRPGKNPLRAAGEQPVVVKLDKESGYVIDDVVEMREVMVHTGSDSCTLVIDMTINNDYVEAAVDSGAWFSYLAGYFIIV